MMLMDGDNADIFQRMGSIAAFENLESAKKLVN
jgi:hypothetical protein